MPDLGRWFGMDQLSESYESASPYAYVLNNPIMSYDPDGRVTQDFFNNIWGSPSGTTWTNNNDGTFGNNMGDIMNNDGSAVNFNTSTGYYGGRGNMNLGTILIPTAYVSGNGWGKQAQKQFNAFMDVINENTKAFDWYGFGGKANWTFAAIGTAVGSSGARFYLGTARPNAPVRFLGQNYYGNGRTFVKGSHVAGLIGKASLGLAVLLDYNALKDGDISEEKFYLNTGIGIYGLRAVGVVPSILYFGIDSFYPGGWTGNEKHPGVFNDQARLNQENSFNPYWQLWPGAMKQ